MAKLRLRQFVFFAAVGAIGTLVHFVILTCLVQLHLAGPVVATSFGAVAGAVTNYLLNYRFTFTSRQQHRETLPKFMILAAVGFVINGAIVHAAIEVARLHYLVAQVCATIVVLIWGYVGNRLWTFNDRKHRKA